MASAGKKKNMTPGRQRKKVETQYFDVGRVGRKTGLVLKDTGILDEHGLEPVSGIFSSPIASPKRNVDKTLSSGEMQMEESSAPEVNETLVSRKTPRLPPPRATTPKHTNIGSPKRMSTGRPGSRGKSLPLGDHETGVARSHELARTQPPANRKLDFAPGNVRVSIEALSPFRPRKVLRRSMGSARSSSSEKRTTPDARPSVRQTPAQPAEFDEESRPAERDEDGAVTLPVEEGPIMMDDNDVYGETGAHAEDGTHTTEAGPIMLEDGDSYQNIRDEGLEASREVEEDHQTLQQDTPSKSKPTRPRISGASLESTCLLATPGTASTTRSKKRDRTSMESRHTDVDVSQVQATEVNASEAPVQKRHRGETPRGKVVVHSATGDETIDPSLLAHGDEYTVLAPPENDPEDDEASQVISKPNKRTAAKGQKPDRATRAASSPVKLNDEPSRLSKSPSKRPPTRGASIGPVSNVNLRATTPFEDAGERVSRYGRPVLKPLQYWANETRVWKHGEVEGIIRAEEVIKPKPKKRKRGRKAKSTSKLDDIDEGSETESVMADEWEEEVGVIGGSVASWDQSKQLGDPSNLVREDLAFAKSSIITRDVANSDFKYAKIMALPFFGTGLVEIPPEGFKRAKNSRKMQMCFFVHEGKVMVEVGAQGEVNQFAISKGGVWNVPRGNNYSITNESRTKTAKIFFAQGCEVEASAISG